MTMKKERFISGTDYLMIMNGNVAALAESFKSDLFQKVPVM